MKIAQHQARAAFEKDLVFRQWVAERGGIYALANDQTPPNPYLASVEERDILTPSGRMLTLLNPAYMTRQVHELGAKLYGLGGHITSLDPIRPQNASDEWETEALRAFERGTTEVSEVAMIDGRAHLRLMRPLITEAPCLQCHAQQGYPEGDVRGGISQAIPLDPLSAIARSTMVSNSLGHGLLWLLGMGGMILTTRSLRSGLRERDRAEAEVKASNLKLENTNQELEAFAYSVSHDLRAPLRGIDGFSKMLLDDHAAHLDARGTDCLARVRAGAQRMNRLIDDLLGLSRVTRRELTRGAIDLAKIARTVAARLQEAEPERRVELVFPESLPATGDPRLLETALDNLLGNAWKFTAKQATPRVEIGLTEWHGRSAYYIRDNGAGFDMAYADKLFEPFRRLHREDEFSGTGIGLAIVRRIVRRHGGTVWAESEVGAGATFYFTLGDGQPGA